MKNILRNRIGNCTVIWFTSHLVAYSKNLSIAYPEHMTIETESDILFTEEVIL